MSARLTGLFVYPIKGCRGTAPQRWEVDAFGLRHDRRWMVVGPDGVAVTQREEHRLALLEPRIDDDRLILTAPGMPPLTMPFAPPDGTRRAVSVWDDVVEAREADAETTRWICEYLDADCGLVYMPADVVRPVRRFGRAGDRVSFADGYPFLLISQAALDDLNRRLPQPIPMNRFRPNLVVDGVAPHAEDGWRRVRIGDISFDVVKPCARCVVTTIDQATAEQGREPLRTLATYRRINGQVFFGQNLIHRNSGVLQLGAAVQLEGVDAGFGPPG